MKTIPGTLWLSIFSLTLITSAHAQVAPAEAAVSVSFSNSMASDQGQKSALPKLSFKNMPLDVVSFESTPLAPLHVVFVLDSEAHQKALMKTSLNYVANLATAIHDSHPTFTILAAGKKAAVLAGADTPADLQTAIKALDLNGDIFGGSPGSLSAGILQGVSMLEKSPGLRTLVVVADNDDDVSPATLEQLRRAMAANHIRCFSILLANRMFSGSKVRTRAGSNLERLSVLSGGLQIWTDWENRLDDHKAIETAAQKIDQASLITFRLPDALGTKPGLYTFDARPADGGKAVKTSPLFISSPLAP